MKKEVKYEWMEDLQMTATLEDNLTLALTMNLPIKLCLLKTTPHLYHLDRYIVSIAPL